MRVEVERLRPVTIATLALSAFGFLVFLSGASALSNGKQSQVRFIVGAVLSLLAQVVLVATNRRKIISVLKIITLTLLALGLLTLAGLLTSPRGHTTTYEILAFGGMLTWWLIIRAILRIYEGGIPGVVLHAEESRDD